MFLASSDILNTTFKESIICGLERVLALNGKLGAARCMFPAITTPEESLIISVKKSKKKEN